jgi:RNA polymerase sigma-70 factor (ECF subfamily)
MAYGLEERSDLVGPRPTVGQPFEVLYERHYVEVLAYAQRRVLPSEAEDVAAETFLVLWRQRDRVPDSTLPWLYGVARHVISNRRRAARRRDALDSRVEVEESTSPSYALDPAEEVAERDGVLAALARLRPADAELLMLVAWEELDPTEAAASLGCSRAAFAIRLHRARRHLMKELDRTGH